jgi:hypothetical protein
MCIVKKDSWQGKKIRKGKRLTGGHRVSLLTFNILTGASHTCSAPVSIINSSATRREAAMALDEWRVHAYMSSEEWQATTEPMRMINWLSAQGYGPLLWDFATDCCRRNWAELPDDSLRLVVEHFEQVGVRGIDDRLHDADCALAKLARRLGKAKTPGEEAILNRRIGYGGVVLTGFGAHDGASAARVISRGFLEWAAEPEAEARLQAESLRRLVPDPTQPAASDES